MGAGQISPIDPAKIVRGSQLIGQTIVDPSSQKAGVIKDILLDSQSARVVYLLLAQEGSDANAEWIVIPFDVLRVSYSGADSQPIFILNLPVAQLRAAPHMRSNAWETMRDPRFIGQVQQFYRQTECTARRPNGDRNSDEQRGRSQPSPIPDNRQGQGAGRPAPVPAVPQPGA